MKVTKIAQSKLATMDFENISFGNKFSDHMLVCDYRDGKWGEPQIMPYGNMEISPACMALHYGQAIFEGMKAYKDDKGEVRLFRPDKNYERFNISAVRMCMPEVPEDIFMDGLKELIALEQGWVPEGVGKSLYIRPFLFADEEMISARASESYRFMIICSAAGAYYSNPLSVLIAEKYSRAASGGVGYAKTAGNYGASFYPTGLARKKGYDQIIWTDSNSHEYIEEAGTMNIMVRLGDKLVTAPISETILNGVTRRSVIQIAKDLGIEVEERRVKVSELIEGQKNGTLKEVFGCGTAVSIGVFKNLGFQDEDYPLPSLSAEESYAEQIKNQLLGMQHNFIEDRYNWTVKIGSSIEVSK